MTKRELMKRNVLAAMNEIEEAAATLKSENVPGMPSYQLPADIAEMLQATLEETLAQLKVLSERV